MADAERPSCFGSQAAPLVPGEAASPWMIPPPEGWWSDPASQGQETQPGNWNIIFGLQIVFPVSVELFITLDLTTMF